MAAEEAEATETETKEGFGRRRRAKRKLKVKTILQWSLLPHLVLPHLGRTHPPPEPPAEEEVVGLKVEATGASARFYHLTGRRVVEVVLVVEAAAVGHLTGRRVAVEVMLHCDLAGIALRNARSAFLRGRSR